MFSYFLTEVGVQNFLGVNDSLNSLRCTEVFPCISADVWPSLSQCQISSAQSATDLITQDQPRTCFEDSTKHVLAFFMGILARGASPELLHCVCEALVTVPTKAPGFGGKKKKETLGFDPELTQALLETLEAYAEQVANYEICDEDDGNEIGIFPHHVKVTVINCNFRRSGQGATS